MIMTSFHNESECMSQAFTCAMKLVLMYRKWYEMETWFQ